MYSRPRQLMAALLPVEELAEFFVSWRFLFRIWARKPGILNKILLGFP